MRNLKYPEGSIYMAFPTKAQKLNKLSSCVDEDSLRFVVIRGWQKLILREQIRIACIVARMTFWNQGPKGDLPPLLRQRIGVKDKDWGTKLKIVEDKKRIKIISRSLKEIKLKI